MYISWANSGTNALPFEFIEVPTFEVSATDAAKNYSLSVVAYGGTTSTTPVLEAMRSSNAGSVDIRFGFIVSGRWK